MTRTRYALWPSEQQNKLLSYRRDTELQSGSVLAKCNLETILGDINLQVYLQPL